MFHPHPTLILRENICEVQWHPRRIGSQTKTRQVPPPGAILSYTTFFFFARRHQTKMIFDPLLDCCCSSEFPNIPFDFRLIMAILRTITNFFGFVRPYIGRISNLNQQV